eukprot:31167-Pelagococcus_subviridis.AAC.5
MSPGTRTKPGGGSVFRFVPFGPYSASNRLMFCASFLKSISSKILDANSSTEGRWGGVQRRQLKLKGVEVCRVLKARCGRRDAPGKNAPESTSFALIIPVASRTFAPMRNSVASAATRAAMPGL